MKFKSSSYRDKTVLTLIFIWIIPFGALNAQLVKNDSILRRHILILYDNSGSFNSPSLRQFRSALFTDVDSIFNNSIPVANGSKVKLEEEDIQKIPFFNPSSDEISFFYFGLEESSRQDFKDNLRYFAQNDIVFEEFCRRFIIPGRISWQEYRKEKGTAKPSEYFNEMVQIRPDWNNGHTFSNIVIPLGLDALKQDSYAEEYIVLVLSDFLSGSDFGNRRDEENLKSWIFGNSNYYFDDIKSNLEALSNSYYKLDYFNFSYRTNRIGNDNRPIDLGILGYQVRPNSGKPKADNTILFLDSELALSQTVYNTNTFRLTPQTIKFSHNEDLILDKVMLLVKDIQGKHLYIDRNVRFSHKMLDNNDIPVYKISGQKISLSNVFVQKDLRSRTPLQIEYRLLTRYQIAEDSELGFVYSVLPRSIPQSSVYFKSKTSIIVMIYVIPGLILIVLLFVCVARGKPRRIVLELSGFSDNYSKIDFSNTLQKTTTDYVPDNRKQNEGFEDSLRIKGKVIYRKQGDVFNWKKGRAICYISGIEQKPEKLEIFLKKNRNSKSQYYLDDRMENTVRDDKIDFLIYFIDNDPNNHFLKPQEVKFQIRVEIEEKRLLFLKAKHTKEIDYHFQIGPDLGSQWIGIDPGTSGTCIAASENSSRIIIEEDEQGEVIMPSVLSFNPDSDFGNDGFPNFSESYFRYGDKALQRPNTEIKFHSVKKLLGYKDLKHIKLNDSSISLSGRQLTTLLIKGAIQNLESYVTTNDIINSHFDNYSPRRAVVAVPNSFTITGISNMISSFRDIRINGGSRRFQEVRYIYESEAVLFNYLANYTEYNPDFNTVDIQEKKRIRERVMVFDVGGATINTTTIDLFIYYAQDKKLKYRTDITGKLGYRIGGDTIDYCLLKLFYQYAEKYRTLKSIDPFENKGNRSQFMEFTLELKKQIIKNLNADKDYYLNRTEIIDAAREKLGIDLNINENDELLGHFYKKGALKLKIENDLSKLKELLDNKRITKSAYTSNVKSVNQLKRINPITEHEIFKKYIYNNIKDAVKDVIDLSKINTIDTVILSGRSVYFPGIKETIIKELFNKGIKDPKVIVLPFNEAKTAVAKGACWYGVNKSRIEMNNLKTNGIFGFKHSISGISGQDEFNSLIEFGQSFDSMENPPKVTGRKKITSDFGFNNNQVEFLQVMGSDPDQIINERSLNHKCSSVTKIKIEQPTEDISLSVYSSDVIECMVKINTGRVLKAKNLSVSELEIGKENEEHYLLYLE